MKLGWLAAAGFVLLAGCTDALPTDLGGQGGEMQQLLVPVSATDDREDARIAIEDAIERIVPGLSEAEPAWEVERTLKTLHQAMLGVGDRRVPQILQHARAAADAYGDQTGDGAELDFIRLALDYTAAVYGLQ